MARFYSITMLFERWDVNLRRCCWGVKLTSPHETFQLSQHIRVFSYRLSLRGMTARSFSCYTALRQAKNVSTTVETYVFSKRGAEHVRSTFQDRYPGREKQRRATDLSSK